MVRGWTVIDEVHKSFSCSLNRFLQDRRDLAHRLTHNTDRHLVQQLDTKETPLYIHMSQIDKYVCRQKDRQTEIQIDNILRLDNLMDIY